LRALVGHLVIAHVSLVQIIATCGALVVLVEPWHDAIDVEVMRAWQEEYLGALEVGSAADGTDLADAVLLRDLDRELLHVLVLHAMHVFHLLVVHFIDYVLVGLHVHAVDRRLALGDGVLGSEDLLLLVLIIDPVQVVRAGC